MIGTLAVLVWTIVTSGLVFSVLSKCGVLRISKKAEEVGVDAAEHMPLIPHPRPSADPPQRP
eukprot:COSAG05_NODE_2647_length_2806_cov_3.529368_5_plen_62_part_00